jgi:hypothetical protein
MRAPGALLVALLCMPGLAAALGEDRDRAAEVRGGAEVDVHLSYVGGATGSRAGSDGSYTLSESNAYEVRWSGALRLHRTGSMGTLEGSLMGEWVAEASSSRTWDYRAEHNSLHEQSDCEASGVRKDFALSVKGTAEAEGIRVRVTGYSVPNMAVPGACRWSRVETTSDGTTRTSGTGPLERNVPLLHVLQSGEGYDADATLLVPYDGRASLPVSRRDPVPTPSDLPGAAYCGMGVGAFAWATGSCAAAGTLTVHAFVDPCPFIRRQHAADIAALEAIRPPPPDEAAIRAWAVGARDAIRAVLGDARAWQLVGCDGDLAPDPWDPLGRVLKMQRDALLALAKEGRLSREGISELLGAERTMQLIGVGDDAFSLADVPGLAGAAAAPGTIEVAVHSPVALHAWSEEGGHVGWNASTNRSESTIPGATYEGAPGGAQRIVLPGGFYKVAVDELAQGSYLLEVATNGTGAPPQEEAYLVGARPGRATSTHYALIAGWEGPRLDAFPVRRGDAPASVAFMDAGKPPTGNGAARGSGVTAGDGPDAAGGAGTPAPGWAMLVLAAGAAATMRGRGRRRER